MAMARDPFRWAHAAFLCTLLVALACSPAPAVAQAQGPAPVAPPGAVSSASNPAPDPAHNPALGSPASPDGSTTAGLPDLVQAPTRSLASWREARRLLAAHQPSLQSQLAAVKGAKAGVQAALSRMLPRLEVGVGADYSLVRPSAELVGGGDDGAPDDLVLVHEFFDGRSLVPNANATFSITFSLANLAGYDAADAGVAAEQRALTATRHGLIGGLAASVLGVLGAERVAASYRAGLEAAQQRMRLTERLRDLGRATELDVARYAQDLGEAEANLVASNESLSQAREALGNALGLGEPVAVPDGFELLSVLSQQDSGCTALSQLDARADLTAARARKTQAELSVRAAEFAYLPELRLVSQYTANYAPTTAITFDGERGLLHNWNATANLVWTAFDGGLRASEVTRSEAAVRVATAEQRATRIAAETEWRRTARLVAVAQAHTEIAQRNLAAARSLDALSRKAQELGTASAIEVVDAARRLRQSEAALAVRDVELQAARVRAYMAKAICN